MREFKIIDASVAIKWFLAEEAGRERALEILDEVQSAPEHFAVPELFFNEMLAVFCKLLKDADRVRHYIQALENLGFYRVANGADLLNTAAQIAVTHNISGYDAVYAASAKLLNGVWLTADKKAHKRIEVLKLSSII